MNILFDHQIFSYQRFGGISKYFTELYKEFNKFDDIEIQFGLKQNVNYYLKKALINSELKIEHINTQSLLKKYFIYKSNQKLCVNISKKNNYDLLHSTFYDPYTIKYNKKPHVITIHDMTPELYPEYYKGSLYSFLISRKWINGKRELIKQADKIIAISENTKKDLIKIYNVPDKKIEVIYHGYNELPAPCERLIHEPYILYVGLRDKYKKFETFVYAVKPILKKEKIKAFCVGGGKFTKNEIIFLKEHGLLGYFSQMSVSDAGLASAYKYALCFVFTSEYEGFGMPILEAYLMRCPIILAKASCFPEIAQNAALFFNINDVSDLNRQINVLLHDTKKREELIEKGVLRLKKFSWHQNACFLHELYRKLN